MFLSVTVASNPRILWISLVLQESEVAPEWLVETHNLMTKNFFQGFTATLKQCQKGRKPALFHRFSDLHAELACDQRLKNILAPNTTHLFSFTPIFGESTKYALYLLLNEIIDA